MKAMWSWLLGVVLLVVGGSTVTAYADWKPSAEMTGRFIVTRDDFDETNVVSSLTVEASGRVMFSPAFWTKRKQRSFVFHLKPETVDGKELYVARTKDRESPFTALALRFLSSRGAWLLVGVQRPKDPRWSLSRGRFWNPR